MTPRQFAVAAAKACEDKKAKDIAVLDVKDVTSIADFFIVCSTTNERQSRAIADDLRVRMKEQGLRELGVEGVQDGRWILQDFGDLVIHIFHEGQRQFYDIEGLWADAKPVRWKSAARKK